MSDGDRRDGARRGGAHEPGASAGRGRRWLRRCGRAGAALGVVGALLSLFGWRAALAAVEEAASTGAALLEAQLGMGGLDAQALELNGQRVFVASRVMDVPLGEALDRFAGECAGGADGASGPPWRSALIRRALGEREGHLACLALRGEIQTAPQLVEAVRRFGQSGDLGALGAARVVRVRARPDGGSHVLAFWTEGEFRPFELVAPEPALAASPAALPLPEGATRDFSLSAPGQPHALYADRVPLPLDRALESYRRGLEAQGFTALDLALEGLDWKEPGKDALVFARGSAVAYVVGVDVGAGARVLVLESGAGRRTVAAGLGRASERAEAP